MNKCIDVVRNPKAKHEILEISFICAVGHKIAVLLDSNDDFVWSEVSDISHFLDDLGFDEPKEHGIYRWSGVVDVSPIYCNEDGFEPVFTGEYTLLYSWKGL